MADIRQSFKFFLREAFDIREGEVLRASLMQINIFLLISTLLIVKPAANALFLSKFGVEKLPVAFILVAISAALVSSLYSRILVRIPLNKIIQNTLLISVLTLITFGVLLRLNLIEGWVLYLFYIWVALFAVLATSQFWVLANIVFNAREAKRLFGFIGAGAIAGGIFGGYLTSILTRFMASENLLFVTALLLSITIPITRTIWRKSVTEAQSTFQQKKRTGTFEESPFQLIKSSKHLTYLASIVGVSVIIAKLVDYQFGAIASAMIPDPDELTAFFGFWFSTFSVVALLIQLFLTRRVLATFGVGTSLFFLPASIMIGALCILFFPVLWAAVFLKMSDGSLKQSINRATMELLVLPIPLNIKNQTKTFIDVFVDSLATGIGGLILIFLVDGLDLSNKAISIMMLALLVVWMFLAYKIRYEYFKTFRRSIANDQDQQKKEKFDINKEPVFKGLAKVLENGNEKQLLFALNKVREVQDDRLFLQIKNLLAHPSDLVRAEAMHSLYFLRNKKVVEEAEKLTHDPSQKVKIRAFEYLIEHSPKDKTELIYHFLQDPDYKVSIAALVSVAKETTDNPSLKSFYSLGKHIRKHWEDMEKTQNPEEQKFKKIGLLQAIGYSHSPSLYDYIVSAFDDKDQTIVKQAILSAGHTLDERFIDRLVLFLGEKPLRDDARMALAFYDKGIIKILERIIANQGVSIDIIRSIPAVMKKVGTQKSVNVLFSLLDHEDIVVRQEALRSLNTLKNSFPYLQFSKKDVVERIWDEVKIYQDTLSVLYAQINHFGPSLQTPPENELQEARKGLVTLLEKRLDKSIERIFRLLGLQYPSENIVTIYEGIRSNQPDLRLNAVEFLDNLLESKLKRILIPIVETSMLETISEKAIKQLNLDIPDEFHCYKTLLQSNDTRLKLAVLYLIAQLKDPKFSPLAQPLLNDRQASVRDMAARCKI